MSQPGNDMDELLAVVESLRAAPMRDRETTGVYDTSFFESIKKVPQPTRSAFDHLEDARVGMALFIEESQEALKSRDLSVEQRVHIATIVSYIDRLAARFDQVRRAGFGKR